MFGSVARQDLYQRSKPCILNLLYYHDVEDNIILQHPPTSSNDTLNDGRGVHWQQGYHTSVVGGGNRTNVMGGGSTTTAVIVVGQPMKTATTMAICDKEDAEAMMAHCAIIYNNQFEEEYFG